MAFNIDLDRGVHSRTDPVTGAEVYMYVNEPGVYRSAHGSEVDVALAERSGFPIEEHLKKRRVQLALQSAHDKVLLELSEADRSEKVVLMEKEGFKIVDIGYDRYQVYSPDDDLLNPQPLNKRAAVILLDQLVPGSEPTPLEPETSV
jgi:hypothetical protein